MERTWRVWLWAAEETPAYLTWSSTASTAAEVADEVARALGSETWLDVSEAYPGGAHRLRSSFVGRVQVEGLAPGDRGRR